MPLGEEGGRGPSCSERVDLAVLIAPGQYFDVHQPACVVSVWASPLQWRPAAVFARFHWADAVFVEPLSRASFFSTCPQDR